MAEVSEDQINEKRIKAAIHYTVGEILKDQAEEDNTEFSKGFVAMLAEVVHSHTQTVATDLEAFAKHAKRSTVTVDDVKLLARRKGSLYESISAAASRLHDENEERKVKRQKKNKSSS